MFEKISARQVYGETLAQYSAENDKVVVLVADVSASVQTDLFAKRFPHRFFNVGIAEAGMIDVAVGLALGGFIPFVNTFACLYLRALEQIRTCVSYAQTNVKLIGGYAGLSDFKDGATHHSIMDINILRGMPNLTIVVPADATEIRKFVPLIAEHRGPVYMRISRAEVPILFNESHSVELGKAVKVSEGEDLSIISTGPIIERVLLARDILAQEGINAKVINMHTIKPLDLSAIEEAALTGAIVTVEEHSIIGGLGSAVSEVLGENSPVIMKRVGIPDTFAETALDYDTLLNHYGLSVEEIVKACKYVIRRKKI